MTTLFTLLTLLVPSTSRAAEPRPVVLHLGLIKTVREHTNFEIAHGRLVRANPDRRIVTMVREREYMDLNGLPSDVSVQMLNRDLKSKLATLTEKIELVYLQSNDLSWLRSTWAAEDLSTVADNPLLALRGHLAPGARIVLIGHDALQGFERSALSKTRGLLEYLGAPRGSMIAQVTPVLLPYDRGDFVKSPLRRAGASAVKGFGVAAIEHLGVSGLGAVDAVTYPLAAAGVGALYQRLRPVARDEDTELKPKIRLRRFLPPFDNVDDVLFTAAFGFGTSALVHGFAHLGPAFVDPSFIRNGLVGSAVFFVLSLAPKILHNLHVVYTERLRHRNHVQLFHDLPDAIDNMHANDPRNFTCARALDGAPPEPPASSSVNLTEDVAP